MACFELVVNVFGSVVDYRTSAENEVFTGEFRVRTENGSCPFHYIGMVQYKEAMKRALRFFADNA